MVKYDNHEEETWSELGVKSMYMRSEPGMIGGTRLERSQEPRMVTV